MQETIGGDDTYKQYRSAFEFSAVGMALAPNGSHPILLPALACKAYEKLSANSFSKVYFDMVK